MQLTFRFVTGLEPDPENADDQNLKCVPLAYVSFLNVIPLVAKTARQCTHYQL